MNDACATPRRRPSHELAWIRNDFLSELCRAADFVVPAHLDWPLMPVSPAWDQLDARPLSFLVHTHWWCHCVLDNDAQRIKCPARTTHQSDQASYHTRLHISNTAHASAHACSQPQTHKYTGTTTHNEWSGNSRGKMAEIEFLME